MCGYSFLDDHLNEALLDGLRGNRKAHCFALMFGNLSNHNRAVELARKQSNLTVLARDGAVVGTRVGRYRPGSCGGDEHKPWLYEKEVATADPAKPEQNSFSHLGDFHYFGLFLEQLCGRSNPMKSNPDPSMLGTVEDVNGSSISVKLADGTPSGLLFVNGEGYRVGQVGGFVRIPSGYVDLFGIISQVGAGAAPGPPELAPQFGNRWLRVELVGEKRRGARFERGISQYPSIGDSAHVVTESDLKTIYAPGDDDGYVAVGRVASAESIRAYLDLNRLLSRHSAVVGSTGAGKSTTVATLLSAVSDSGKLPGARVVLLDLHGEYAKALGECATVFRLNPRKDTDEQKLCIPYWALAFDELVTICLGGMDDKQRSVIADLVVTLKQEAITTAVGAGGSMGIPSEEATADTPVPFCLRELWFRQHYREYRMVTKKQGGSEDDIVDALVLRLDGKPEQVGDAMKLLFHRSFAHIKTLAPKRTTSHLLTKAQIFGSSWPSFILAFATSNSASFFHLGTGSRTQKDVPNRIWMCSLPLGCVRSDQSRFLTSPGFLLRCWTILSALYCESFSTQCSGDALSRWGKKRPLLIVLEEAHRYLEQE